MPDIPSLVIYVGIIQFVLGMAWQSGHREQTSCYTGAAEGVYDHVSSRTSPPGTFPPWLPPNFQIIPNHDPKLYLN